MLKTPFLTGFPTHLFGSAKKKTQEIIYEKRRSLIEGTLDYQQQFIEEIPPELLERHSQTERKRHYPDSLTFWAFFSQVTSDDASCAATVARVQAWAEQRGLPVPSQNTGAYCQARADLPLEMLQQVNQSLSQQLEAQTPSKNRWRGLRPRVEDGTIHCRPLLQQLRTDTTTFGQGHPLCRAHSSGPQNRFQERRQDQCKRRSGHLD